MMPVPSAPSQKPAARRRAAGWRLALAAALAAMIVAVAGLSIEFRRRNDLYWYDVRQDYQYRFGTRSVPVELSTEGFVFPPATGSWDTAVLRLRVGSGWTARWLEPSVTIESERESNRQFFERGAEGTRYLLLPRSTRAAEVVRLRGDGLTWSSQRAELLLWDNALPPAPTVLVLAPHPDDGEIAAFGLYAAHHSFVATVTAGNYVDSGYEHLAADDAAQDELRGRVRTWDSLAVPAWGGVASDRVVNLGYSGLSLEGLYAERQRSGSDGPPNQQLARHRQGAVRRLLGDRSATATWGSLVEDLAALIDSIRPDIVVAPHPVLDGSSDHQLTTVALFEALARHPTDRSLLFLYTNHHVLSEYYPFGPSDSHVTLPPWFDPGLAFGGLYSFDLDVERQIDKLFALEAHHDLRAAPRRLLGGPTDRFVLRFGQAVAGLVRDPVADYSYYRRAVRPNEIFFVYAPDERQALATAVAAMGRQIRVAGLR